MKIFVALGILLSICFRVCDSFEFLKPMQIGSRLRSKAQPQVQQLQAMQVTAPPRKKAQNETRRPGVAYGANKPPSDAPVSRPSAFATNLLTLLEAESVGTLMPKEVESAMPTPIPSIKPGDPTPGPTAAPSGIPTCKPSALPTYAPTENDVVEFEADQYQSNVHI